MTPTLILIGVIIVITLLVKRKDWFGEKKTRKIKISEPKKVKDESTDTNPISKNKQGGVDKKGEWLGKILLVVFLLILAVLVYLVFFFPSKKPDQQKENSQTQNIVTNTIYWFENFPDKKIEKYFDRDIHFYPKGGPVKITPPSGNWYIDTPGVQIYRQVEDPGIWIIEIPRGSKAWGIEIWN